MFDHTKVCKTLPEEREDTRPPIEYCKVDPAWPNEYHSWFVNRRYFCIQSKNPGANGKHFYFPPKGPDKEHRPLTVDDIRKHLAGVQTINLQSVNPVGNSCKWMAVDADYPGSVKHLNWLIEDMADDGLHPIMETSRRGGHVWVLFSAPVPALLCRAYIANLALCRNIPIKMKFKEADGIELFPGQSTVDEGKYSNGLRGPLGVHRATHLRYWFRDVPQNLEAHMEYLRALPRTTPEEMDVLASDLPPAEEMDEAEENRHKDEFQKHLPEPLYRRSPKFDAQYYFDLGSARKEPNNYKVRCPSCAERGGDTSGDNLAIKRDDTRLIYCFNNCSYYDVVDAAKRMKGEPTWPRR